MYSNETWINLFRRIPASLQDIITLGLTTGSEFVIQRIVRLEPNYLVIRGRLSGTTDTGRVVVIPYPQITYIAVMRILSDAEVESIFGKGEGVAFPEATAAAAPAAEAAPGAAPQPAPEAATVNDASSGVNPPKKKDAPSKTVLLAKLRDRLKDLPAKK